MGTGKLVRIALFTNLLEWYEFSVYGYLAGTIGQLFFKTTHPTLALIQAFAIFAASHLVRPIGSLFFGSLGDRFGRSYTLKLSLILMSVPTILVGMLPTYHQIGWVAPICLLILRLIQGFAAGGELPLIGCYVYEAAPPQNKGLLCSAVITSNSIGIVCGSLVHTLLVWTFTPEEMLAWAWRIPFLLGIPLTCYVFYIRHKLLEFQSHEAISLENKTPLLTLITTYRARWLQCILLIIYVAVGFYLMVIWMPTYLVHFLGYPQHIASLTNALALSGMMLLYIISGWLSDRLGYKRMIIFSICATFLSTYALFLGLQGSSHWFVLLGIQLLFGLFLSGIDPLLTRYLGDNFPRTVRASGMATLTVVAALFGGTAPFICTWVIYETGLLTFPALYITVAALLALPVALRLKSGTGKTRIAASSFAPSVIGHIES